MSEDNFGQYFPRPDVMPRGFNGDPEEALAYARDRQVGRYNVEAFQACLAFFDGWRPISAALPWIERLLGFIPIAETRGERGPARDPQAILDIKSLAEAVNGTCLNAVGQHKHADNVIARAGRCFSPSRLVRAVLEARHSYVMVNLYRFAEAQKMAERVVEAFEWDEDYEDAEENKKAAHELKPFLNPDMALLTRGYVKSVSYAYGNAPMGFLIDAIQDATDVLASTVDDSLLTVAADMLVSASACLCFAGFEPIVAPVFPHVRSQTHRAKSNWAHALIACAKSRYLSAESEEVLLASRTSFLAHNMSFEALLLTLDLQFWLVVSGRLWQAATESDLVRELLPAIKNDDHRDAISLWLSEVDNMMLSYATAERVLTEVRMIVKPNNLRSLIGR